MGLAVVVALGVLAVVGAAIGLVYLINLPVGPSRRLPKAAASLDVPAIGRALDGAMQMTSGRLPSDIQLKVTEIRREIIELLPRTTAFAFGSEDLYVIERTATDYLPTTLQAYLTLPEAYATTQVLRDGKTPLQAAQRTAPAAGRPAGRDHRGCPPAGLRSTPGRWAFLRRAIRAATRRLALPPEEQGSIDRPGRAARRRVGRW